MDIIHGKVNIPKDYFNRIAKKEYVFWPRAIIREFLQNSVDAGSSIIKFRFLKDKLSLVVQDDGCGMDKNVILNKLLILGESSKKENSNIGGFGKAKEILFFAWEFYAIHTKNFLVEGRGSEYSVKTIDYYFNGTRCIIKFHDEQEFNDVFSAALEYLPRNEVKSHIYLNDSRITYLLGNKRKIKQFEWGTVYLTSLQQNDISVRVNGLEMFKKYTFNSFKNQIIVELNGYSTDVLTSNRDLLVHKYSTLLSEYINDISTDPISSILDFDKDIQEIIHGEKLLIPESLLLVWHNFIPFISDKKYYINKSEFYFKDFNYEFFIRRSLSYNIEKIRSFMNDSSVEYIVQIWTFLLLEIIIANKIGVRGFTPGFVFSDKIRGLCCDKTEYPILLINPFYSDIITKDIVQLKDAMEDIAYHEIAHIYNRSHNENFVITLEQIRYNHRKWKRFDYNRVLNWRKFLK